MRQELIENPVFLRYYERWQKDPTSVVFAAISEIFRANGMIDDAIKIAKEGLKHHPELISGQLALAKAYLANGEMVLAKKYAMFVLERMPNNLEAKRILQPTYSVAAELALPQNSKASFAATIPDTEEEQTEDMPITEVPILADEAEMRIPDEASVADTTPWHTLTMADILKRQGHFERARKIYKKILEKEPDNKEALEGLEKQWT